MSCGGKREIAQNAAPLGSPYSRADGGAASAGILVFTRQPIKPRTGQYNLCAAF